MKIIQNSKLKTLILFTLTFTFYLLTFYFTLPTFAQTSGTCSNSGTAVVQGGLVSTPNLITSLINNSGGQAICVIDPKAAFAPYKIPGYDDLKSLYFDQYKGPESDKFTKNGDLGDGELNGKLNSDNNSDKKLIYVTGNVGINSNVTGTKTAVVFVQGYLSLTSPLTQFTYGDGNSGIVFVVNGDVNIASTVTRIDAVIIAGGKIYTAGANCSFAASGGADSQLVINGSLISLTDTNPIQFCRKLSNNNCPTCYAEQINHQVKYLVILRNLMSDTYQRWSEIQ